MRKLCSPDFSILASGKSLNIQTLPSLIFS